jgi:arginine repressor
MANRRKASRVKNLKAAMLKYLMVSRGMSASDAFATLITSRTVEWLEADDNLVYLRTIPGIQYLLELELSGSYDDWWLEAT